MNDAASNVPADGDSTRPGNWTAELAAAIFAARTKNDPATFSQLSESERTRYLGLAAEAMRLDPGDREFTTDGDVDEVSSGVEAWSENLTASLELIKEDPDSPRSWTFDMDDRPELADVTLKRVPVLRDTLEFLMQELFPVWKEKDREALGNQKWHTFVANLAIWSGVAAVALAIIQLVASSVFPGFTATTTIMEVSSVMLALLAVVGGIVAAFHHNWLTKRQCAERLRSLKFQSLAWHELWCDLDGWKQKVKDQISRLSTLGDEDAEHWATAADDATPDETIDPGCPIDPHELKAITDYYRVKRLEFQQHYFDRQSKKARRYSWGHRWHLSLVIFFLSVVIVLGHGLLSLYISRQRPEAANHSAESAHPASTETESHDAHLDLHALEICLVGLAALLPVIGFGVRAWMSAFEFPRSQNLFRAKALALEEPIKSLNDAPLRGDPMKTLQQLNLGEHFLITEHREWCRLQLETEWFL